MDLFTATLEGVAVLLTIGLVGFWIMTRRIIAREALMSLSTLAIFVALPALAFTSIIENFRPAETPGWWMLPVWWALFTIFAGLLAWVGSRVSAREVRREFAMGLFYQNAVFFPLIILTEMYGADSALVTELFIFTILFSALLFTGAPYFFNKSTRWKDITRIIHPVTVVTMLAAVICLAGAHDRMPGFALSALSMMGMMSAPLLMLIIGGSLYLDFREVGRWRIVETLKFVAIKNFVYPFAALGLLMLARPPWEIALLIMLQAAAPPVTSLPILTQREGGDRSFVCQYMTASFLCSLISLPLALGAFGQWYPAG